MAIVIGMSSETSAFRKTGTQRQQRHAHRFSKSCRRFDGSCKDHELPQLAYRPVTAAVEYAVPTASVGDVIWRSNIPRYLWITHVA